ncbi:MAG TPA: SpoIIE family protein phosphatase, partial [Spirochaetia bacterium]|nr:SpoIIE family protein phosphatase [Spirochaetia bacterium]
LSTVDDMGNVHLTIRGRGFIKNGAVQAVYLTRSETPPYDRVLNAGTDAFSVSGDTQITGPVLDNSFPSGSYAVGLLQTSGKPYFWQGGRIDFEVPGTIRVGSFNVLLPRWIAGGAPRYGTSFDSLIVALVAALLGVVAIVLLRSMVSVAQEGILIRNEVLALLEGRPSAAWVERKTRMKELRRRGAGLRLKFTLLMVVLVAIIVLIVSVPLGVQMIGQQSQSLADGLEKRTRLLIGTIAASSEAEIRKTVAGGGDVGIGTVPDIIKPLEEAVFATITGPADPASNPDVSGRDYVWASNSDAWKKSKAAGTFVVAAEPEKDGLSASVVPQLQKRINDAAPRALAAELDDWQKSRDRIQELSGLPNRTLQQTKELQGLYAGLSKKITAIDNGLKTLPENDVYSEPRFDVHKPLASGYLFYKPIVYFHPEDKSFYQGLVRIEINTTTITRQIADSRNGLIRSTALIALAAIALGILMAVIMASITVTPIRKLARGVQVISDTEDKEKLEGHTIVVRTRDEIGDLAATVNEMTKGLVEKAKADSQLRIGKDVQKRFLPLKSGGTKSSNTAEEENDKVVMFGYYEGAKGVSGDYFDIKKLDDIHYALIKCDISGKGVPAALIMVEVATLFINYFRDWLKRKEQAMKIADPKQRQSALKALERVDSLVYTINDMVEERGFDGRFAALTICIYNSATGEASICHAGDNIVNIYRAGERRMVPITLAKAPAAGTFASFMVESTSPYTQVVQRLSPGDVLFFYTDGLEEAQRHLRNAQFEIAPCQEPGLKDEEWHGTHQKGKTTEEFGTERIRGIIEAVFSKGRFRLVRSHNPIPDEVLEFDFSVTDATVRDAVLALVAVEKVYRQIPDPSAGPESRVHVYEQVDAFLRKTFLQYASYFSHPVEGQQSPGYLTFTHAKEDEQYDDLTLLVIRRK